MEIIEKLKPHVTFVNVMARNKITFAELSKKGQLAYNKIDERNKYYNGLGKEKEVDEAEIEM